MSNEDIVKNFNLCIEWIKGNVDKIGVRPLYIGWGEKDYMHPWLDDRFDSHTCSLQLKDGNVRIQALGDFVIHEYGYTKEEVTNFINGFKNTGMRCLYNRHEFCELGIGMMEIFLLQWKSIKGKVLDRIDSLNSLDNNFEI